MPAMKYRHVLSRRTLLKAGGGAVGLPFLDCMLEKSAYGAPPDAPASLVSLMYGLGTPDIFMDRGYGGPLGAYKPLVDANKLSPLKNMIIDRQAHPPDGQHQ